MKKNTLEDFIKKSQQIHNNKYDYSKVEYINNRTKVCIICPEHGEFWQTPHSHLSGCGCCKCKYDQSKQRLLLTTEDFINKAIQIHGDKYTYSKVNYIGAEEKVCIICPKHGEFWQTPSGHLSGYGCPKCYDERRGANLRDDLTTFISKAKQIHGDKYDYSKVKYINSRTEICIICPEHGEFWQTPNSHLNGNGCPSCKGLKKLTTKEFIERAKQVHGNKYDYSKTIYVNKRTKVCIICPIHGEFYQTPHNHVYQKQGCPECGKKYAINYNKNDYENSHSKITIQCLKCGNLFTKIACDHITSPNGGCQHCYSNKSKAEEEIYNFIKTLLPNEEIYLNDRHILNGTELDIYIPNKHFAIEFDGLYWHSNKDKNYHLTKTESCESKGIQLIHIFEDEYQYKKDIVLSKIKHILKCNTNNKIFARKCQIKEISYNESNLFLEKNHIQGGCKSNIYIGAFYKDNLVSVMTFREEVKNSNKWELTRFANDINYQIIGTAGKLLNYFIKNYNPEYIKSFADRRWSSNLSANLYNTVGFKLYKILSPDYRYYINGNCKRFHKFNFRKQTLLKRFPDSGLTEDMTEYEMTQKLGFYRIWDCGLFKYVWKK